MFYILTGSLLIGLTLGLLGAGGSAITVPVLIYLVGHGTKESITESMAIVGMISIAAAVPYATSKQIDWRNVLFFGLPGMLGTLVGAWLGGLAAEAIQLVVFGGVLLAAALIMLRRPGKTDAAGEDSSQRSPAWKIGLEGIVAGILTGFVGVGGGFLIVPALVLLGKLPMRLAIGTSLVIIAFQAAVGFTKYEFYLLANNMSVDWQTILIFTVIGIIGSIIGRQINTRLNQQKLKTVFAGFLLLLGGFVIVNEGGKYLHASVPDAAPPGIVHANQIQTKSLISVHNNKGEK
ncbi:sulfite exporter TauE/SafE family protein [Gimesia algae]|uniref:Probable membrane transporter protein n=1 Tax=Gimesia algae TaxID=2527971 RepID=A0A517V764_9PLAN|nr:sulfite exporter TauE/SafE family protein [Gimesia algae]QDT88843.1 Sulfite exporter TauE/SafE [Gimesia algae]